MQWWIIGGSIFSVVVTIVVGCVVDWWCPPYLVGPALPMRRSSDDGNQITDDWLRSIGFGHESINGVSLLIDSHDGNGDPVELYLGERSYEGEPYTGHVASLLQSNNEDHVVLTSKVFRTRGDIRQLLHAMGVKIKQVATK